MIDPAYDHELAEMHDLCSQFVIAHLQRVQRGGDDLTPELLLIGMVVGQAAKVYNLSPPGGLINPGSMFTGGPPEDPS